MSDIAAVRTEFEKNISQFEGKLVLYLEENSMWRCRISHMRTNEIGMSALLTITPEQFYLLYNAHEWTFTCDWKWLSVSKYHWLKTLDRSSIILDPQEVLNELDENDPNTLWKVMEILNLYPPKLDPVGFEALLKRAIIICDQQYGEDHPLKIELLCNLGKFFWRIRKYEAAECNLLNMVEVTEHIFGSNHQEMWEKLNLLLNFYKDRKDLEGIARTQARIPNYFQIPQDERTRLGRGPPTPDMKNPKKLLRPEDFFKD